MNLKPIWNPTFLVVAVVYGIVLTIAAQAGLFGVVLRVMITLSLWRYAYQALHDVARGRTFITPPGIETTNPFGELSLALHFAFFGLLPVLFVLMPRIIGDGTTAEVVRGVGLAVWLGIFPASLAVMGMTRNLAAAVNPIAIGTVIAVLRGRYLVLIVWIALAALAATFATRLLAIGLLAPVVDRIIMVWGTLTTFVLVGSAINAQSADFAFNTVAEVSEQRAEDDRRRGWQSAIDHAYASIRSGHVEQGYRTIKHLIAAQGDRLEIYQWVFNRLLDWKEEKHALDLAKRFLVRLVEEKQERTALDLVAQCRRMSASFEVPPEVAGPLSIYARSIGRPRLADDLAGLAQRAQTGEQAVSPRAPTP